MENYIKVNSLVELLHRHNRPELISITKKYPDQQNILELGNTLGESNQKLEALSELAISSLKVSQASIEQIIQGLKKQSSVSRKITLVGNVTNSLIGAGLVAALFSDNKEVALITAILNLIVATCVVVANHISNPNGSGNESIESQAASLITASSEASELIGAISISRVVEGDETLINLIKKANTLASQLRAKELKYGQS